MDGQKMGDRSKSAKVNEDEYRRGAIITKGRLYMPG